MRNLTSTELESVYGGGGQDTGCCTGSKSKHCGSKSKHSRSKHCGSKSKHSKSKHC